MLANLWARKKYTLIPGAINFCQSGKGIIDLPPGDWLIFLRNGGDIPISVAL